jgi:hypothetical protein
MTEHPTPLALERLFADDLPAGRAEDARQHLERCGPCQALLEELGREREQLLEALPPDAMMARLERRRSRRASPVKRTALVAASLAACVAAAVAFWPREPSLRLKGATVEVFRKRGDDVKRLAGGDRISASDALRVVVTLRRPERISAWYVDATGRVDPAVDGAGVDVPAGEVALPGSVVVESPCVDLWLVVLGSAPPHTEAALRRAVRGGVPATDAWMPRGALARRLQCD